MRDICAVHLFHRSTHTQIRRVTLESECGRGWWEFAFHQLDYGKVLVDTSWCVLTRLRNLIHPNCTGDRCCIGYVKLVKKISNGFYSAVLGKQRSQ